MSSPQPFGSLHGCGPSIILEVSQKARLRQTISAGVYEGKIQWQKLICSDVKSHVLPFINKLLLNVTTQPIVRQPFHNFHQKGLVRSSF